MNRYKLHIPKKPVNWDTIRVGDRVTFVDGHSGDIWGCVGVVVSTFNHLELGKLICKVQWRREDNRKTNDYYSNELKKIA